MICIYYCMYDILLCVYIYIYYINVYIHNICIYIYILIYIYNTFYTSNAVRMNHFACHMEPPFRAIAIYPILVNHKPPQPRLTSAPQTWSKFPRVSGSPFNSSLATWMGARLGTHVVWQAVGWRHFFWEKKTRMKWFPRAGTNVGKPASWRSCRRLGNWKHTGNTVRTVDLPSPNDAHRQLWAAGNICFPTPLVACQLFFGSSSIKSFPDSAILSRASTRTQAGSEPPRE